MNPLIQALLSRHNNQFPGGYCTCRVCDRKLDKSKMYPNTDACERCYAKHADPELEALPVAIAKEEVAA